MWSAVGGIQACDWLCAFQNVNPADGCCVAIGFLSSCAGVVDLFRLHDDDGIDTKKKKEKGNRKNIFLGE